MTLSGGKADRAALTWYFITCMARLISTVALAR